MVEDKYLVLRLLECYGCDEITPGQGLIVNLADQSEVNIGDYGDLVFDTKAGSVTAKKYELAKNGQSVLYHYEANGESKIFQLP